MLLRLVSVCLLYSLIASAALTDSEKADRKRKRRNRREKCPRRPRHGKRCVRHPQRPPCGYNKIHVPGSDVNGDCTGNLTCEPSTICACVGRKWDCTQIDYEVCQSPTSSLPDGSFEECNTNNGPPTQAPTENIFTRDDCPETEPNAGESCTLADDIAQCTYEHRNYPVYESDGRCLGGLICGPFKWYECLFGTWELIESAVRQCNGGDPPGAWEICTP